MTDQFISTVSVSEAEYARHLGYDDPSIPDGVSRDVAAEARAWFEKESRPFSTSRVLPVQGVTDTSVILEGDHVLHSERLAERFSAAGAHAACLAAVSAGPEVDREYQRLWNMDRPDLAYALNAFAAAFTEQYLLQTGAALCAEAEQDGGALLAHYSPGYDTWDVSEQKLLLALIKETHPDLPLETLESSMLVPQKSQLAVFGITQHKDRVEKQLIPCERCSLNPCSFRRAPFREDRSQAPKPVGGPGRRPRADKAEYRFPPKALLRWTRNYLELDHHDSGLQATFRFEGSTCSDGGVPMTYLYAVDLARSGDDYLIKDMRCWPAEDDQGYTFMCSFKTEPKLVRERIEGDKPLLGEPLSEVLYWDPNRNPAGCLCSQSNRNHKWLMALQTLHFALSEQENK